MEYLFIDTNSTAFYILTGLLILGVLALINSSYKRCPSDKILIIFGQKRGNLDYAYYIGRSTFTIPFIHKSKYLKLTEFTFYKKYDVKNIEGGTFQIQLHFTYSISKNPALVPNAVENLLDLPDGRIQNIAEGIISDETRNVFAELKFHKKDRLKIKNEMYHSVKPNLEKVGIDVLNLEIIFL